jgi:MFS family permease
LKPSTNSVEAAPQIRRNVRVFCATSFLNDTASEMSYWILPAFLTMLGAGPEKLGIIEGVAESVASLGKLFSGYLTDRLERRKPIVVFGYALANVMKPVLAITTAWWQVLLVRFADRTAKGIRGAPRDVMLTESAEPGRLGSAFGLLQAMDSAGAIVGPLIALLLMSRIGIRGVFWTAAVPGLLSIAVVSALARETGILRTAFRKPRETSAPMRMPARYYWVVAAVTLFSLGNSSDMFLVLRAQSIGIAPHFAPLLGLVFNVTYTAASWPAGRLSDRVSRHSIAAAGYVIFAVVYLVFASAPSRMALWVMMALYGFYYALSQPVLRAMVAETAPAGARGRAFGIYFFVTSVATLLASILTGQLWKHFGAALPFHVSGILALLSALMLLAIRGEPRQSAAEPA